MYEAELHLQQEKDCVLSQLAREFGEPLDIMLEELHDHNVTFVINAGEHVDSYMERIDAHDSVVNCDRLDEENIGVTKQSCGAYSAVYGNHGILRRHNHISSHERVYNILFFNREDLKSIIADFREIGTVTLGSITEFGDTGPELTTRQREVIETALRAGYFQWPRAVTSEELADQLGVSRVTCLEHLRKAEGKLLSRMLEDDGRTSGHV